MTFEADLKSHLGADVAIAALVGDRIMPPPLKENGPKPAITYTVIDDDVQSDLDGEDGALRRVNAQIDCWALSHDTAKELVELVRVRMKAAATSFRAVPLPTSIQDYDFDTKQHRAIREFSCWYRIG